MATGLLWYTRLPATSTAWQATIKPVDARPARGHLHRRAAGDRAVRRRDLDGVAPLTSTLMSSVPTGNAGVASAINNAISRVGQPILAALIFVVVSGTFYATLGAIAGVDPNDPTHLASSSP